MSEQDEKPTDTDEAAAQADEAEQAVAAPDGVERHPSAQFNPAHPDNAGWANNPPPPDMPAEAGIVAMFQDQQGPISEPDVTIPPAPGGAEHSDGEEQTDEATSGSDAPARKPAARRRSS